MRRPALRILCSLALLPSPADAAARSAGVVNALGEAASRAAPSRQKTRVLLLAPFPRRWRARAWGQLSDLPVVLDSAPGPRGSAEPTPQTLARLARENAADVVAWLSIDAPGEGAARTGAAPGTRVLIYEARERRMHERQLGAAWSALDAGDRSAALEAAALTLRSVLRARLVEAAQARPPEPEPEPARAWGFRVSADASWQLDGQTARGSLSLGGALGVAGARWSASVGGQWGLPADIAAREATLRVVRHELFVDARHHPLQLGAFDLGALVRGGLARMQRATVATSELAVPLPRSELTSALLGAGLVGRWRPTREHALELVLAADAYAAPPLYTVSAVETGATRAYALWTLQPSLSLAWAVVF